MVARDCTRQDIRSNRVESIAGHRQKTPKVSEPSKTIPIWHQHLNEMQLRFETVDTRAAKQEAARKAEDGNRKERKYKNKGKQGRQHEDEEGTVGRARVLRYRQVASKSSQLV